MAGEAEPKCTCILAPPRPGTPGAAAGTRLVLTVIDPDCHYHKGLAEGRVTPKPPAKDGAPDE